MEEFQKIIAQIQHKEITEESGIREILALLENRERYCHRSFEFLTEVAASSDYVFRAVLTSVFDNVQHYERVGPYPFNYFFNGANRFLLSISDSDRREFIKTFKNHKDAYVRALLGDCLMEWGQSDAFSLIEEALMADIAHSDTQENVATRLTRTFAEALALLKDSYSEEDIAHLSGPTGRTYLQENIAHLYTKRVQSPLMDTQIQALFQAVRKSGNLARLTLVEACGKLKDARLVPILTELLDDHQAPWHKWANFDPMCYYAANVLKEIDTSEARQALDNWTEKEFQTLKQQMQTPNGYGSSSAHYYAAKLGDARFIPLLAEAVQKAYDVDQEFYALAALTKFHHDETIEALIDFIRTWQSKARTHGEHKVFPTPPFILSNQRGYRTLWEAIKALGEMKAKRAVSTIVYALSLDHHLDEWEGTHRIGVQALRSIGTAEAMEALKKFD